MSVKITKPGTIKTIQLKCNFCDCEFEETTDHLTIVGRGNPLILPKYHSYCPTCKTDVFKNVEPKIEITELKELKKQAKENTDKRNAFAVGAAVGASIVASVMLIMQSISGAL